MDTPEIDEGQEVEQVALQDDIESAYDDQQTEETTTETAPEETVEGVLGPLEAPSMWSQEYKDTFNEWGGIEKGRDYQQSMIDLYGTTQAHVTKIEQESAQFRKSAEDWDSIFSPYQEQMNLQGTNGPAFMRQVLGYYQQLNANPAATLMQLAQNYNIDLSKINEEAPYQSPAEQQQAQRISMLERAYQNNLVQARNNSLDDINQQIDSFASKQDASGNPEHPHFQQVREVMTKLINGNAAANLTEAYDMACKLSPEVAAQASAEEIAQTTARKAAEAKKAKAASKRPTGQPSGKEKTSTNMKDDISAEYDKMVAA